MNAHSILLAVKEEKTTKTNTNSDKVTTGTTTTTGTVTNTNAKNANTTSAANANSNINTNQTQATVEQAKTNSFDAFTKMNFSNPSWDMMIVFFFIISTFLYGWSLGRDRIIVMLVSIYMALTVVKALPDFVLKISLNDQLAFRLTTFIALFVVLFFFISRSALLRTIGANMTDGKWYQTIIFSILHVGLLISIAMSFLPPEMLQKFAPVTQHIFRNEWTSFGWVIAPVIAMVIFGSKKEE